MEDFPIHHRGHEAANLLASWTALWHPALIASAGEMPGWHQTDNPDISFDETFSENSDEDVSSADSDGVLLAVIPLISESLMDSGLLENLESEQAVLLSDLESRDAMMERAIEANAGAQRLARGLDEDLVQDFCALGYSFLQVQLMTRQLRYSSNLDETHFSEAVTEAARFATDGDLVKAREALGRCFDLLLEEKDGYYPVQPELMDVVLTASTTLGRSMTKQLEAKHPINLLLSGQTGRLMAEERPQLREKTIARLNDKTLSIVGGLAGELPDSLIAGESILSNLTRGRAMLKSQFGVTPSVFMRRRFGLTPALPSMLEQLGFSGAVHATLDGGKFPLSSSCNIRWTGDDDQSILAIGDVPLSAADAGAFLGLGVKLGEQIDSAHVAAAVFVHWPDRTCESFRDLVRISKYGALFGKFVTLDDYFDAVYDPGYGDTFASEEYKPPYFKQSLESESRQPISAFTNYFQRFAVVASLRSLLVQACHLRGIEADVALDFESSIDDIQSKIEAAIDQENSGVQDVEKSNPAESLDDALGHLQSELKSLLEDVQQDSVDSDQVEVLNTLGFRRVVEVQSKSVKVGTLKKSPPVYVCDSSESGANWVVELPPMGSVGLSSASVATQDLLRADPLIGEDHTLRNEFFELLVDEETGGIRSIQLYKNRVNLISQQLALRLPKDLGNPGSGGKARYTRMSADEIKLTMESRITGTLTSRGTLLDNDSKMADYWQKVRVTRGQRVVEVEGEIIPTSRFSKSINHYACSRLAWKSEASRLVANAGEIRQDIYTDWFHATQYVEVVQDDGRLTMLTGGLPYHRRASRRFVDSVLIAGNESQHQFAFGLGVNLDYPLAAAMSRMTPPVVLNSSRATSFQVDAPAASESSWSFHFNRRNVMATWWSPVFEGELGQWVGVKIRLRETEGRAGALTVRCPRSIAAAERVKFSGESVQSLELVEGNDSSLIVEFGRHDYFELIIRWKK